MNTERVTYEGLQQEVFIKELESILAKLKSDKGFLQSNRITLEEQYCSHFQVGSPHYYSFMKLSGEKEFRVEFVAKVW